MRKNVIIMISNGSTRSNSNRILYTDIWYGMVQMYDDIVVIVIVMKIAVDVHYLQYISLLKSELYVRGQ